MLDSKQWEARRGLISMGQSLFGRMNEKDRVGWVHKYLRKFKQARMASRTGKSFSWRDSSSTTESSGETAKTRGRRGGIVNREKRNAQLKEGFNRWSTSHLKSNAIDNTSVSRSSLVPEDCHEEAKRRMGSSGNSQSQAQWTDSEGDSRGRVWTKLTFTKRSPDGGGSKQSWYLTSEGLRTASSPSDWSSRGTGGRSSQEEYAGPVGSSLVTA
ncbi:hypothetical protein IAR55_006692 [Kwoniella newhampshirensis]|uniref:Uncharacterized protein n=1 Tax=Kwoniella newhampshirensis TaxID=1651941 RepID=A0AAW0YTN2_9TREE